MKKLLVASSLAVALASGAFAGENKPSFDIYAGGGTNQNFSIGGDLEIDNKKYTSGSFKSIDDKQVYQVSLNALIHNDYESLQTGGIGAGLMVSDADDVKFKPMITGSYTFDGYAIDGYIADSHNYGGSIVKGLWSKGIGERNALSLVGGVSYDKVQGVSENTVFLKIRYVIGN